MQGQQLAPDVNGDDAHASAHLTPAHPHTLLPHPPWAPAQGVPSCKALQAFTGSYPRSAHGQLPSQQHAQRLLHPTLHPPSEAPNALLNASSAPFERRVPCQP